MTCIVPQLSKCLKFEAVWAVLTDQIFEFEQRGITGLMRVLLFTEWRVIIT